MADEQSPIPDVPNFEDAQILRDQIQRNQRHLGDRQETEVIPKAAGGAGVSQGAVGESAAYTLKPIGRVIILRPET
jgi:hypothetical protein